jgi:hypothetical protein
VGNEWVEGAAPADSVLKFNGYKAKKTLVGKFGGSSPFEIAMYFLSDIIDHVVECTNLRLGGSDNDDDPLTVVEMYHWIGFRLFMTIINFPNTKIYFDEDVLSCFDIKLPNFSQILSYDRYCFINSFLTFEQYDNNISDAEKSETDHAWKVRTMTTMLKSKCQACLPSPKQHLSLDEGMAMCTLRRCPILHHVLNKPIDTGFKFFMLVDHDSKICIDFNLADKVDTADNCKHLPYGFVGHQVMKLLQPLKGTGHIIYVDNYYSSMELAKAVKGIGHGLIGTMLLRKVPNLIDLGGKKPLTKGPRQRGLVKMCHNADNSIHLYGFMDTAACYFIDTVYGGKNTCEIERRLKQAQGKKLSMCVPTAIREYNDHMGGVDAFDQVRTGRFSLDSGRRGRKWTMRYFETIISIALTNVYNIVRVLNRSTGEHMQLQIALCKSLLSAKKRLGKGNVVAPPGAPGGRHELCATPPGSMGMSDPTGVRCYRACCRGCENLQDGKKRHDRRTINFCKQCLIPLHVECFALYFFN